jgi:hypothetical protein
MAAPPTGNPRAVRRNIAQVVTEELDAFAQEHRGCGELTGGLWVNRVWARCHPCGAWLRYGPKEIAQIARTCKEGD